MRLYATQADLRAYTGDESLVASPQELRSASMLVQRATRHAVYAVGGDGRATDASLEGALRDATCEVLRAREQLGVSSDVTLADLGLQSASIGSASYTVSAGAPNRYRVLPFDAHLILDAAGLLGGPVVVQG